MAEDYGTMPARARVLRTTSDLHLSWDVPFEPGTLRAIGKIAGKIIATDEIATTGKPAAINLSADRTDLSSDGRDVVHLTVQIVDADQRTVPTADNEVTFDVQGPAKLIGVDNGNPISHESFKANHIKAFSGMCLGIVESTLSPGLIRIAVSADGLRPAAMELNSQSSTR
jgi:beta-galactosidase